MKQPKELEPSYGHFSGGDPRNFSPDVDCCTEKEINAWKQACKEFNEADQRGTPLEGLPRTRVGGIRFAPFGIGIQYS